MLIIHPPLTPDLSDILARAAFPRPDLPARLQAFYAPGSGRELYAWAVPGGAGESRVVAALGLRREGEAGAELTHIATRAGEDRQGYSGALLREVAAHLNLSELWAETDEGAVGFYRRCGFGVSPAPERGGGGARYRCVLSFRSQR